MMQPDNKSWETKGDKVISIGEAKDKKKFKGRSKR